MKRIMLLLALLFVPSLGLAATGPLVGNTYKGSFHNRTFNMGLQIEVRQDSYSWQVNNRWALNFRGKTYHFPALTGTSPLKPTTNTLNFTAKTPQILPSFENPKVGIYIYGFNFNFSGNSKQVLGTFTPAGAAGTGFTLVIVVMVNNKPQNTYYYGNADTACYNIVLKKKN